MEKKKKKPVMKISLEIVPPVTGGVGEISANGTVNNSSTIVNCFAIPMTAGATIESAQVTPDSTGDWSVTFSGLSSGVYLFQVIAAGEGTACAAVNVGS